MASDSKKRSQSQKDDTHPSEDTTCLESPAKRSATLSNWLAIENPRVRVSIIGTAGRGNKGGMMSKSLYTAMVDAAIDVIEKTWKLSWCQIDLVSGGAAWADHLAVTLFLQQRSPETRLLLFLPCPLDASTPPKFHDNGKRGWKENPAPSANRYHQAFTNALGYDTLSEIQQAGMKGAIIDSEHFGFHSRNVEVSKSTKMLAFTWSDADEPTEGGTKHTWSLCQGDRLHIRLAGLDKGET